MFLTARVTVCSFEEAANEPSIVSANTPGASGLIMGVLQSCVEQEGYDVVDEKRDDDKRGCHAERNLDEPRRQRADARLALGTRGLRGTMDQPIATAETCERRRDDVRLVRRKPRQVADPGPAHTKPEQDEREDAAR